MRIIVDADACPVKDIIKKVALNYSLKVIMVADTSHIIGSEQAEVIIVDKGADSADICLINIAQKHDIIVTQDYGVAAMAIGKGCYCINQNGLIYDENNIDSLLFSRHLSKKIRRSGGKINSVPKRTKDDDKKFEEMFTELIQRHLEF